MDRKIIYSGQIPLETDLLGAQKNSYLAVAKLAAALFGTTTFANGLACSPNAPADLTVIVGPGEIYALKNIDDTAYSSIASDTTHQIVKQGVVLSNTQLSCPAPGTVGFSINYLVQAAFSETDDTSAALPYYNASNPTQAWVGPNNSGSTQNTNRANKCVVTVKAGAAAATGTQTTPAPDSGNVGLWVVTVANGATSITAGNIIQYAGAPYIPQAGAASNAHNSIYSKSVAGNSDVTLDAAEAAYPILNLTGTLTGNINVIVPAGAHQWIVRNNTSGSFSLTVKTASGTGVAVSQGKSMVLYCDAVNVVVAGAANDVSFVKTSFTATAGQTVFSGLSYTVGNIWVERNGVSVPFTGTNGTSITLSTGANLNDIVDIYQLNSFSVANALPLSGGTLSGPLAMSGAAINEAQGSNIASAATVNLDSATGNYVHITGTTGITALTLSQGRERTVVFDGALTLTNGASLILPGGANITTAAGDSAIFRGEAAGVVRCIAYIPANGYPLLSGFGSSLAASGYQKLPSGLIIQWGVVSPVSTANYGTTNITFPVAFPNACLGIELGTVIVSGSTGTVMCYASNGQSKTGFTLYQQIAGSVSGTFQANWIAIGY